MFGKMHVLGCWARLGVQLLYLLGLMHDLGAEHLAELRQLPKRAFYAARALHAPDPHLRQDLATIIESKPSLHHSRV